MQRFGVLLSNFIKEYQSNIKETDTKLEDDPLYILTQFWEEISKYTENTMLTQIIQSSEVKTLEVDTLTIKTQNSNARFLLKMNSYVVLELANRLIQDHRNANSLSSKSEIFTLKKIKIL